MQREGQLYEFELEIVRDILMKRKVGKFTVLLTPGALSAVLRSYKEGKRGKRLLCVQAPLPWQLYFTAKRWNGGNVFLICASPDELPEEVRKELLDSGWTEYEAGKDIRVVGLREKASKEVSIKAKLCIVAPVLVDERSPVTGEKRPVVRQVGLCKEVDADSVYLITCDGESFLNCAISVHMELRNMIRRLKGEAGKAPRSRK